ncbi:MAG: hypothetical protein EZS28_034830, partial [Streblomastix strix]
MHRQSATGSRMSRFLELASVPPLKLPMAAPMEELLGQAGRPLSKSYRLTCTAASYSSIQVVSVPIVDEQGYQSYPAEPPPQYRQAIYQQQAQQQNIIPNQNHNPTLHFGLCHPPCIRRADLFIAHGLTQWGPDRSKMTESQGSDTQTSTQTELLARKGIEYAQNMIAMTRERVKLLFDAEIQVMLAESPFPTSTFTEHEEDYEAKMKY